ncbi:hypothetical protein ABL78_5079 [Leptomonas seymouri]|uniref:Uncharacterized protein n=1 Tax=Leptomonas seymouri TaxID=5684 RepID=A0A0N0P4Z2_LEPSE|nr:hypothetical protein ABL78_5079 [Leptomonas seymouri]|eukprot:KPI85859.1 hypothetical protein ABL78_5079 [Leptomonas seymouri]
MERSSINRPRLRRDGAVAVTHRSNILSASAVVPDSEDNALPVSGSSLYGTHSDQPTFARRNSDCRVSIASSRGASHAPAVWLFDDSRRTSEEATAGEEEREDPADVDDDNGLQRRLESERRHRMRQLQPLSQSLRADAIDFNPAVTFQAPSPRVMDNRLHMLTPGSTSIDNRRFFSLRTVDESASTCRSASASAAFHRAQEAPSQPSASARSTSFRSHSSSASSSGSAHSHTEKDAAPSPSSNMHSAITSHVTNLEVDGLGPLMVVHLDVLPALRQIYRESTATPDGNCRSEQGCRVGSSGGETAAVGFAGHTNDSAALVVHPDEEGDAASYLHHLHMAPTIRRSDNPNAVSALVVREADEAHTRETTALYTKLEVAEQRARIAEQQVSAAAEVRAEELVKSYKADERKRRAQFQASLDALREENRDLTAKLDAAARATAMGLRPSTSAAVSLLPGAPSMTGGEVALTAVGEVDVAHQVQSVEAYWRDRLRNAERHWEDEMSRQTRQRREALDQIDELVRTVEQTQEELRYTRRQAARLREENVRLARAAPTAPQVGLSASGQLPHAAVSTEEVARLRQALKEHQHREAALLAQVESYGEESTRVRLRYEAALERAQQELAAERRRSTELVKLYGSQLESLHHQLRKS